MDAEMDADMVELAHELFDLARDGRAEELDAYLEAGLTPDLTNSKGDTLLILAAYHKHPETVAVLVARGAVLDTANDRGQTALAASAFRDDVTSMTTLLAAGADPHAGGPTALETARFFGNTAALQVLDPA